MHAPDQRSLGDYLLLGEIARGGMGVVYQAVHTSLNRSCALKVIRAGNFASAGEKARFVLEAEATAALDHPNIVRVRHAGDVDGQLFLEMELVEGGTLADRLLSGPLPFREAAILVSRVARAVDHAHSRGVLHRDLKPGNVLLDTDGAPRLTDFGLARLLDRESDLTRTLTVLGTPAYLAPELAKGGAEAATTAADVYGLGALLYECLAGRAPYVGESPLAVLGALQAGPPSPLIHFRSGLPRDLEILVSRAMAREPLSRLSSARELADEIDRWLRGDPIRSRPVPVWEQLWAWARRRRALATLAVALGGLVAVGFVATEVQRRRARELSRSLLAQLSASESARAAVEFRDGRSHRGLAMLARGLRRDPDNRSIAMQLALQLTVWGWPRPEVRLATEGAALTLVVNSPTGDVVLGALAGGGIRAWNLRDGSSIESGLLRTDGVWKRLAYDESGRWVMGLGEMGALRVWSTMGGEPVLDWKPANGRVIDARFQPGQAHLVLACEGGPAVLVDLATPDRWEALPNETRDTRWMAFDSETGVMAMSDGGSVVRIWNLARRRWEGTISVATSVVGLSYGNAGRHLVVTTSGQHAVLFQMPEGKEVSQQVHTGPVPARFDPGGTHCFTRRNSVALCFQSPPLWRLRVFPGANEILGSEFTFSRDGSRVLFARSGNRVQTFDVQPGAKPLELGEAIPSTDVPKVALFLADPNRVMVGGGTNAVVWSVGQPHPWSVPLDLGDDVMAAGFSQGSGEVRVLRADGHLGWIRLAEPGRPNEKPLTTPGVDLAAFSPDAARVAVARGKTVEVLSVDAPEDRVMLPDFDTPVSGLVHSRDGRMLAVTESAGRLRLWDEKTRAERSVPLNLGSGAETSPAGGRIRQVDFSSDSRWIVVVGESGWVQVFEAETGRAKSVLEPGGPVVRSLVLSGGKQVATATVAGEVRLWELETGLPLGQPWRHGAPIRDFDVSLDGRRLATAGDDHFVRVWEVGGGLRSGEIATGAPVLRVRFLRDGSTLLSANRQGLLSLFDGESGLLWARRRVLGMEAARLVTSPDGRWVVAHGHRGRGALMSVAGPETRAPSWVPELAEALAGERFREDRSVERLGPGEYLRLRERLRAQRGEDYWHALLLPWLIESPSDSVRVETETDGP